MAAWSRSVFGAALGIAALMSGGCGDPKTASQVGSPPQVMVLTGDDQPLRDDFNRDQGFVRLMLLVDPRCPECLRGLADMGDDVLAKLPKGARIKVYVVHEPVIGGNDQDIRGASELLHTTLARHYWNPTGDFGRQMSQVLGLLHGSRPVYAWDIYMIYPASAVWSGQDPPQPSYLMHQLPGLDNQKFPPWDGKVFATKVGETLASGDQRSAVQTTAIMAR
jgi:hypothetical protein